MYVTLTNKPYRVTRIALLILRIVELNIFDKKLLQCRWQWIRLQSNFVGPFYNCFFQAFKFTQHFISPNHYLGMIIFLLWQRSLLIWCPKTVYKCINILVLVPIFLLFCFHLHKSNSILFITQIFYKMYALLLMHLYTVSTE